MTALSIVICNKNARILFSRQFTKMSRLQLEEHVVYFSRNIDSCKDTTHFESDKARFLFIPTDNLFLVLITKINSNIIEDSEMIKFIYRLVQDLCQTIDETQIKNNCFELAIGIDDIVFMGYRNSVSLGQVRQFMQMESQEEKEFRKKQEVRENLAKKQMQEKMREIEKLKRENKYTSDAISSAQFENTIRLNEKFEITPIEPINKVVKSKEIAEVLVSESPKPWKENVKVMATKGMKLSKKKKVEDEEAF